MGEIRKFNFRFTWKYAYFEIISMLIITYNYLHKNIWTLQYIINREKMITWFNVLYFTTHYYISYIILPSVFNIPYTSYEYANYWINHIRMSKSWAMPWSRSVPLPCIQFGKCLTLSLYTMHVIWFNIIISIFMIHIYYNEYLIWIVL